MTIYVKYSTLNPQKLITERFSYSSDRSRLLSVHEILILLLSLSFIRAERQELIRLLRRIKQFFSPIFSTYTLDTYHTILVKNSYQRRQWQKCWLQLEMMRKSLTLFTNSVQRSPFQVRKLLFKLRSEIYLLLIFTFTDNWNIVISFKPLIEQ